MTAASSLLMHFRIQRNNAVQRLHFFSRSIAKTVKDEPHHGIWFIHSFYTQSKELNEIHWSSSILNVWMLVFQYHNEDDLCELHRNHFPFEGGQGMNNSGQQNVATTMITNYNRSNHISIRLILFTICLFNSLAVYFSCRYYRYEPSTK